MLKILLAFCLCINLSLIHADNQDMTCSDMQFYSRSMTKAELESNILEMTAFYGEYKDIFDKLLIASTSNEVIFDKYFFDIYGTRFMNMSISMFRKNDFKIIKYLLINGISPLSLVPGESAPIFTAVQFERTKVLELFFEEGLVLNKCQYNELYDSAKLLNNTSMIKIFEGQR